LSFEEAELIRERAQMFLENAKRLIEEGFYDLAAFNIEQYCQLILKYKALDKNWYLSKNTFIDTAREWNFQN
jgi:HEPN domain-containing protein